MMPCREPLGDQPSRRVPVVRAYPASAAGPQGCSSQVCVCFVRHLPSFCSTSAIISRATRVLVCVHGIFSDAMSDDGPPEPAARHWRPEATVGLAYSARFRTATDRAHVGRVFHRVFGVPVPSPPPPRVVVSPDTVVVGEALLPRCSAGDASRGPALPLLHGLASALERVALCVELAWPCMLVGPSSSGACDSGWSHYAWMCAARRLSELQ
jgi:hypothetical protein